MGQNFKKGGLKKSILLACFSASHAMAQSPPSAATPPPVLPSAPAMAAASSPRFAIRGFSVKGDNPLGEGVTSQVLAPFLRSDATIDVLQKATQALETALRDKGFGLHRVVLPPQEVGDTVSLEIVKFALNRVKVEGNTRSTEANVRASLPELQAGGTPNFKRLAVQTAIANDNPGKQVTVSLKESDQTDKIDATVLVKDSRPWTFGISASNTGSASSGRDRVTFSGGHSNLFDRDHQLIAAYTTSLERIKDVKQLGLSYRVPLYAAGGVVGASYTQSDVLGNFGAFTSTGAGRTMGLNYTQHLPPNGGQRSYVSLGLDDKLFNAAFINGFVVPGQLDRRSRPLVLGYTSRTESDAAFSSYNVELAVNVRSGSGNKLTSYKSEDARISTAAWKALRGGVNYMAPIASNWLWAIRGQAQVSGDALISGEQFGLGGVASVRGAADRVLVGDSGLSSTLEATTPELGKGFRAVGFIDAGWVSNHNTAGSAKLSSDTLASVGLGLRYAHSVSGLALSADYGRIVAGSSAPSTTNPGAPQKGSDKLHVNLSIRF